MNNRERELWVLNDEGLYRWWKQSRMSMSKFIKENRDELDSCINEVLNRNPTDTSVIGFTILTETRERK